MIGVICKHWLLVSLASHFVSAPVVVVGITPVGIGVGAVSVGCFLYKHPGKSVTPQQLSDWDSITKNSGLR